MRDVLGITAIEKRLEIAEARRQALATEAAPAGEAPPINPAQAALAMLAPKLPEIIDALIKRLLGAEPDRSPQSILWDEVEKRYEARKRAEMAQLAEKIVGGGGLIIEDKEPGQPDGGPEK